MEHLLHAGPSAGTAQRPHSSRGPEGLSGLLKVTQQGLGRLNRGCERLRPLLIFEARRVLRMKEHEMELQTFTLSHDNKMPR